MCAEIGQLLENPTILDSMENPTTQKMFTIDEYCKHRPLTNKEKKKSRRNIVGEETPSTSG